MKAYELIIKGLQEAVAYEETKLDARKTKCTVDSAKELTGHKIKATHTESPVSTE